LNNLAWLTALYDGNAEKALGYANSAVAIGSHHADFLDTRGVIYLKAGAPKQALDDLSKAVESDPSSPSKLFHLAQAQFANNEKENARESLKLAKTKGLTARSLHTLEQKDYQELLDKLG
jgi:Tfp pilus assembly protein PilF